MESDLQERKTKSQLRRTVVLSKSNTQINDHETNKNSKAQTSQVLSPRAKRLPKRHARTQHSPTQWVAIEPADAEFDSSPLPRTLGMSSEFPDHTAQESQRYRLQRSSKAGSVSPGSQIFWWHKDKSKSTKYRLRLKEAPIVKRQKEPVAHAQPQGPVGGNLLFGILFILALYLICNPALNYICKDTNKSGYCHDDRYPRLPLTTFSDDYLNQKTSSVNQKFAEIESRNKDIYEFYFSLSNSTGAIQKLRSRVLSSTIAPRERILLGLHQYIANAKINGKLQILLRAFVASVSNNKERVEFYTKTVFEAVGHLKAPFSLDSKYPTLSTMLYWPFWLPLDHFSDHSISPMYLAASHFDKLVASTKPRSEKCLRLARNLQSTLLEQIGHLDSLFTNADVVTTTAWPGRIVKTSDKANTSKVDVAIVSRPSRRLSRLWVQTGGEEQDKVSEALDWIDGVLPQVVETVEGTIQSINEIAVLLDEIETYANNLRDHV